MHCVYCDFIELLWLIWIEWNWFVWFDSIRFDWMDSLCEFSSRLSKHIFSSWLIYQLQLLYEICCWLITRLIIVSAFEISCLYWRWFWFATAHDFEKLCNIA
jgi:hypothetical protein